MLRGAVIDDEPRSLTDLARRLTRSGVCEVVAQSVNPVLGLQMVKETKPDFLLLDIEMPTLDGVSLAAMVPPTTAVVFVSAHSSYGVAAFEVPAFDYILKPVEDARFERMLQRLQHRFADAPAKATVSSQVVVIDTRRGKQLVPDTDILAVFAEDEASRVLLRWDRHIHCLRPLKHFEGILRPERFVRLDRSTFLNIEAIKTIRTLPAAKSEVTLVDSATPLAIGRAARGRLQQFLVANGII